MAKSELAHDEQALLNALVGGDGAGVGGHNLGHSSGSGSAAHGDHAVHDVAFGEDAHQFSVAQNGHGADVVLHHVARGLEHSAGGFDGIHFSVFDEIAESRHGSLLRGSLLRHGETSGMGLDPAAFAVGNTLSQAW